ncbi:MAG: hypothetical protein DDT42_00834 [candidate division WS2 bacterium]|uniref:Type I restriction modification DNA specificity domain-containing protein n=1 Tax=Psychracetigena formicireducens TaxID=2986056 RepID=A0A9E2F6V9_PSYF1|nr:hypothetical protein [Candidatus Psychracetigena formicireducens]
METLLTKGIQKGRLKIQDYQDTEIGRIPKEWEVVKLGDIGDLQDGDWILKEDYTDSGVRLLQVGDIGLGAFIDKSERYISNERANQLKCTFVDPDEDVLISRMPDPIGRACLAPLLSYPYIVAVDVTIFRLEKETANPKFIIYSLNNPSILKKVSRYSSGATRQRISRTNLEQIPLPLPPLPEQQNIAEILSTVDQKIELLKSKKEKYEKIKKGLMEDLLTGKRRVKV